MIRLLQPLVLAFLLLAASSCTQAQNKNSIDAQTFATAIADTKGQLLLDVRTPEEYTAGHIKGAKNIDWTADNFTAETEKLDKKTPVYIYCHSGRRSERAAKAMRKDGFEKVYELKGGFDSWETEGLPTE